MKQTWQSVLVFAVSVIAAGTPATAADPLPMSKAVAAQEAAVRAIRTLSASFEVAASVPKPKTFAHVAYRRNGSVVRIHGKTEANGTMDVKIEAGEVRIVIIPDPANAAARPNFVAMAKRLTEASYVTFSNPYEELLLTPKNSNGELSDWAALLAAATITVQTRIAACDGEQCIAIDLTDVNQGRYKSQRTYWLWPSKNYLIGQLDIVIDGTLSTQNRVVTWAEPAPGVILPVKSEHVSYDKKGAVKQSRVAVLSDVVVNQPIDPAAMAMPSPLPGSFFTDEIAGIEGKTGPDWKPIGPTKPFQRHMTPVPAADGGKAATEYGGKQSPAEPVSAVDWVWRISIGCLVVGIGLLAYRTWRGRSTASSESPS